MGDVIPFPSKAKLTEKETYEWENPMDMLSTVMGQIAQGVHNPQGVVIGLVDDDDYTIVYRFDLSVDEIEEFFEHYIQVMRSAGLN